MDFSTKQVILGWFWRMRSSGLESHIFVLLIWLLVSCFIMIIFTGMFMSIAIHNEQYIYAFWHNIILVMKLLTSRDVSVPGTSL